MISDNVIKDKLSKFYFRSVCIRLVALRMNLYQKAALSFKTVGDPWLRDNFSSFFSLERAEPQSCLKLLKDNQINELESMF